MEPSGASETSELPSVVFPTASPEGVFDMIAELQLRVTSPPRPGVWLRSLSSCGLPGAFRGRDSRRGARICASNMEPKAFTIYSASPSHTALRENHSRIPIASAGVRAGHFHNGQPSQRVAVAVIWVYEWPSDHARARGRTRYVSWLVIRANLPCYRPPLP